MSIGLRECFEFVARRWTDEVVVTSAGNASEMWWEITRETERVFYLEASMSLASMFAAGIARGIPAAKVWCFSGDGAFCMNPGMLMVERAMGLPNLKHFLVSNGAYGSTHDAALANRGQNDYKAIARGVGLHNVHGFGSLAALQDGFDRVVHSNGHAFTVLEVEPLGETLPSPPMDGPECKFRFGRYLERTYGVRIFDNRL
jgi:sulfopyruvate decarboxylase subunit beta